jgi:hypothetical protein
MSTKPESQGEADIRIYYAFPIWFLPEISYFVNGGFILGWYTMFR